MHVVIDTNVAVVANNKSTQADASCVSACADAIRDVMRGRDCIVLDDEWRILKEYIGNLSQSGQPGVGDAFLKWVLTNQKNPTRCCQVHINCQDEAQQIFREFPTDPRLRAFDPSDRKFVAVCVAKGMGTSILQGVDQKWQNFAEILLEHTVRVQFLC